MANFKTILACLGDADSAETTLGAALEIGRRFAAHVEALHVRLDAAGAVPLVGEGMTGGMIEEMLEIAEGQADERAGKIRAIFGRVVAEKGVGVAQAPGGPGRTASWREEIGREEEIVAQIGRLTDLLVMARPLPDRDTPSIMSINAGLIESGRPLLVVPPEIKPGWGERVVVFWNGSAEATRAVAAAIPFLTQAKSVAVLSAAEAEDFADPAELADYLAWHGVRASAQSFQGGAQVGQTLLAEAARNGADMVVMGAYTHSRLRQLILGGVTRFVLHNADLPILFSH